MNKSLFGKVIRLTAFSCLLFISDIDLLAQNNINIKGQVQDAITKEPLIGVSVQVKGTTNGVITDLDGNFALKATPNSTIRFSYIGYNPQEIKSEKIQGIILMNEDSKTLQEVVVVGYGTQKKVNLSGAVSAIDGAQIAAKPSTDVLSALQGEMPGVAVLRSSGQPGSESSGMRIRGFSSVNSTSTLVLIDGVEGDMSLLNADDIASISVLKDAAAASIYGARAAAGVVLVTTKNGTAGKPKITYSGSYTINLPGNMPKRLPAWEEQTFINESRVNTNGTREWNEEQTSWVGNPNFNYRPNNDTGRWDFFEATNWVAKGTKNSTSQQSHSVSVSGGSKDLNYLISAKYYTKNGLLKYGPDNNDRYNLLAKVNSIINKNISLGVNIQYQSTKINTQSYGATSILNTLYSARGRQPIYNPAEDINISPYNGDLHLNAIDIMKNGGTNSSTNEFFTGKAELIIKNYIKGLRLNLSASRRAGYYSQEIERRTLIWYSRLGTSIRNQVNNPNSLYKRKYSNYHDLFEATLNYELSLDRKHNFTFLAGSTYENYRQDQMNATAYNMNSNDFFSFNYYDTSINTNTLLGDAISPWSMMSYFGRVNYNFADRYLFEANIRYDGSSRLAPGYRWKAFPSLSAAWRINQEQWFKVRWIDNLKLRASWGELGNGAVLGLYDYMPLISDTQRGVPPTYLGEKWYYQAQLASKEKTWETISTTNIGVDLGVLNNRLTASLDYYWKYNNDMLSSLQLPHTIGIDVPEVNIGKLKTWGWEIEIGWKDKIKDFSYQVSFNLSDSQNKLLKYDGASVVSEGSVSLLEGYELNSIWGYKTDGYWKSREEYEQYKSDHPGYKSFNDGVVSGGDVKYLVQGNADHQLSAGGATPEDSGDLVYLGNSNGRYLYGLNLSAQWKGFDFNVMFQGVGKRNILVDASAIAPFYNSQQMPWTIHRDYWTEQNTNSYWPRLYNYAQNDFNFKPSDKWMQNAAYIRLKNITLGYTVPIPKKYIERLRVYVAGSDVWEHSNMLSVFDPEVGNNVNRSYYPFFRSWTLGLNVTF